MPKTLTGTTFEVDVVNLYDAIIEDGENIRELLMSGYFAGKDGFERVVTLIMGVNAADERFSSLKQGDKVTVTFEQE